MFGVKIVITGDKPPKNENSIIIMNHRCRLDWMFYWNVAARYGGLQQEKIIMKHELKHIPGPGKCLLVRNVRVKNCDRGEMPWLDGLWILPPRL